MASPHVAGAAALYLQVNPGARAPAIRNLLIAAVAEHARLVVLHVDKSFELIADVTGQSLERLP